MESIGDLLAKRIAIGDGSERDSTLIKNTLNKKSNDEEKRKYLKKSIKDLKGKSVRRGQVLDKFDNSFVDTLEKSLHSPSSSTPLGANVIKRIPKPEIEKNEVSFNFETNASIPSLPTPKETREAYKDIDSESKGKSNVIKVDLVENDPPKANERISKGIRDDFEHFARQQRSINDSLLRNSIPSLVSLAPSTNYIPSLNRPTDLIKEGIKLSIVNRLENNSRNNRRKRKVKPKKKAKKKPKKKTKAKSRKKSKTRAKKKK